MLFSLAARRAAERRQAMETSNLRKGVAVALAATGALHLVLTPEYSEEQAYLGVLFVVGGLAAIGLAWAVWTRADARALVLGTLVALGMGVGFILSRTVGLPGFHETEWELSGLVSLLLEGVVIVGATQILKTDNVRGSLAST
jgi:hypothetical protein